MSLDEYDDDGGGMEMTEFGEDQDFPGQSQVREWECVTGWECVRLVQTGTVSGEGVIVCDGVVCEGWWCVRLVQTGTVSQVREW